VKWNPCGRVSRDDVRAVRELRGSPGVATHPPGLRHNPRVGGLARRIVFAPVVLVAVAVVIYGGLRILRPDLYPPGDPLLGGIVHDLDRALLHLDLGCAPPGGKTGASAMPS